MSILEEKENIDKEWESLGEDKKKPPGGCKIRGTAGAEFFFSPDPGGTLGTERDAIPSNISAAAR